MHNPLLHWYSCSAQGTVEEMCLLCYWNYSFCCCFWLLGFICVCVCVCDLGVVVSENFIQGLFFSIKRERERDGTVVRTFKCEKKQVSKMWEIGKSIVLQKMRDILRNTPCNLANWSICVVRTNLHGHFHNLFRRYCLHSRRFHRTLVSIGCILSHHTGIPFRLYRFHCLLFRLIDWSRLIWCPFIYFGKFFMMVFDVIDKQWKAMKENKESNMIQKLTKLKILIINKT